MASQAVYDAIRGFLEATWPSANPPLAFENDEFTPPQDESGRPLPWIAVEMSGTLYAQMSIGASQQADNRWDEEGQLWFHIFVRTGAGTRESRGYAKTITDLFRGRTLLAGSIEFLDASIGMGADGSEDGNYYRISVNIDWRHIEA